MTGLRLEVGRHAMTGDLLYLLVFTLLAALVVVPALFLMRRSSPRRGGQGGGRGLLRPRRSRSGIFAD